MTRRKRISLVLTLLGLAIVAGVSIRAAVWWKQYPNPPEVAKSDLHEVFAFIGSRDFNRMTESHRQRYALAFIDRTKEMSLSQLTAALMDARTTRQRDRAFANMRRLKGANDIYNRFCEVFLGKFYELPEYQRTALLTVVAFLQGGDISRTSLAHFLPQSKGFEDQFRNFVSSQSPHLQALSIRFLLDFKARRASLGFNDPF